MEDNRSIEVSFFSFRVVDPPDKIKPATSAEAAGVRTVLRNKPEDLRKMSKYRDGAAGSQVTVLDRSWPFVIVRFLLKWQLSRGCSRFPNELEPQDGWARDLSVGARCQNVRSHPDGRV